MMKLTAQNTIPSRIETIQVDRHIVRSDTYEQNSFARDSVTIWLSVR
jgi:hypothetical protein